MNNEEIIKFSNFGSSIGSRDFGAQVRHQVKECLSSHRPVTFDFSGIEIISSAFADELFGKLCEDIGLDNFRSNIKINGFSNEDAKQIILLIIKKSLVFRLGSRGHSN